MTTKRLKLAFGFLAFILTFAFLISGVRAIISGNQNVYDLIDYNIYNDTEDFYAVPAAVSLPTVDAQGAILIDTDSGDIIHEVNCRKRLPMASTTKIMTAITAIESGFPLDKIITVTKQMTGAEGSSIYLYAGERFTLYDLIYALLLNSANDSAEAIAVGVAGSIENFAVMMNEKVKELGLSNTNFTNPHGLDNDMHYTTAYDLAKISAYALENEVFYEIASDQNHIIYPKNPDGTDKKEGARYLRNHNKMLRLYKDSIGVKTGFTKRSGRCLVSAAERDGTRLVAVTLNASDDWNDHREMLDYGFDNYRNLELCKENEFKFEINVVNGANTSIIKCENIQSKSASLPKSVSREDIKQKTELPQFVYAPVKKGDIIGRVVFTHEDKIIGYSVIVSCEDAEVNKPKKFGIFK